MFLLPDINLKLRPKILDLKPGTRIVSNTFTMGDWEADATADLGANGGCSASWCTALLWIVPAKVGGIYKIPQGELVLIQHFQKLTGSLRSDGKMIAVVGRVDRRGHQLQGRRPRVPRQAERQQPGAALKHAENPQHEADDDDQTDDVDDAVHEVLLSGRRPAQRPGALSGLAVTASRE